MTSKEQLEVEPDEGTLEALIKDLCVHLSNEDYWDPGVIGPYLCEQDGPSSVLITHRDTGKCWEMTISEMGTVKSDSKGPTF